jgi:hypothetical protein
MMTGRNLQRSGVSVIPTPAAQPGAPQPAAAGAGAVQVKLNPCLATPAMSESAWALTRSA